MKKFAIITVCLNVETTISDTIQSVLEQNCGDFEYLIKDGGSKDRTVQIAESFIPAFADRSISYRIISQPDGGIYDAMNQAVREAKGEWVIYMNAGDRFADGYVLSMVEQSGCLETADIVYGDRIDYRDDAYRYQKALPLERMRDRLPFCHQSVFAKKCLYDKLEYSLRYRLCSDYMFFYHWYQTGKRFAYVPIAISLYDRAGVSSNGKRVAQELLRIHEEMPVTDEAVIQMLGDEVNRYDQKKNSFIRFAAAFLPKRWREKRRVRKNKQNGWMTKEEFFQEKAKNGGRVNRLPNNSFLHKSN